ncbi:MAG: alpha/beta fold hydrolase [Anaerolineales bacterium]|nr:alpha/beta fold hydrolase [Anaerolineales bacterium]
MTTYQLDGQTIHTIQRGQPGRQVALLVHGWSSSWYALEPLLDLLAQRYHCIAVDLPGYGDSPEPRERITIPYYADLLAQLIARVSDRPVVYVGHSMGGMIGATLALRHPALIDRMVLIAPTLSGQLSARINWLISPITRLERFAATGLLVRASERLIAGVTDELMRPVSFAQRSSIRAQDYERLRADARRRGQGRTRYECYFAMRENDLSGRLGTIETPTLVVWGAEDNTVPLRDSGIVADEWPRADLRILPKAGHWPQFEQPELTRRHIAAFLGLPLNRAEALSDQELVTAQEVARFISHSDIGSGLTDAQRIKLSGHFRQRQYEPGQVIVRIEDGGNEMYIVRDGSVEVWNDPDQIGTASRNVRHIASLTPGQITGELAMLDGGLRSADLRAGPTGATVLVLDRTRLEALCREDPELGTSVLWNISRAMAGRVRFILWQLQRALSRTQTGREMEPARDHPLAV